MASSSSSSLQGTCKGNHKKLLLLLLPGRSFSLSLRRRRRRRKGRISSSQSNLTLFFFAVLAMALTMWPELVLSMAETTADVTTFAQLKAAVHDKTSGPSTLRLTNEIDYPTEGEEEEHAAATSVDAAAADPVAPASLKAAAAAPPPTAATARARATETATETSIEAAMTAHLFWPSSSTSATSRSSSARLHATLLLPRVGEIMSLCVCVRFACWLRKNKLPIPLLLLLLGLAFTTGGGGARGTPRVGGGGGGGGRKDGGGGGTGAENAVGRDVSRTSKAGPPIRTRFAELCLWVGHHREGTR